MRHATALAISLVVAAACTDKAPLSTQPAMVSGAAAQSTSGSNTAVTSTVADLDATIAPSLQIRSDGGGAYKNSSTLISIIQVIGDWELDSYNPSGSTRTLYLDFSQPIAASGPNGGPPNPIPSGRYKVHAIAKCSLYNNNFFTLAPGAVMNCPLHLGALYVGTRKFAVQMNPLQSSADTAWAETNWTSVRCAYPTSGTGSCSQWTMTPSGVAPDGSSSNVAALLEYVTTSSRGKTTTTTVKQGDFRMAFRIGISNP